MAETKLEMPEVGDHVYIDEGDSIDQYEYAGYVEQVDGTQVLVAGYWIDLADVEFWEVDE